MTTPAGRARPSRLPVDADGRPLRLLSVHAHPDDETTTAGATAARYAAEGVQVHLVTCTRGERGEILDDAVRERIGVPAEPTGGPAGDEAAELLGRHRVGELAEACRELGVLEWSLLGGSGRWWDSGMAGEPTADHSRAFAAGDLEEQAAALVPTIRRVQPQVVVTYDERGGYGHPDHIRAHEVTMRAVAAAADPKAHPDAGRPWQVAKVYACVVPRSVLRLAAQFMAAAGEGPNPFAGADGDPDGDPDGAAADGSSDGQAAVGEPELPFGVPDEMVTAQVDARDWLPAKVAAMRAHRTQMQQNGWFFTIAERSEGGFGVEYFQLLSGQAAPPAPGEREDDLFCGLRAT